MGAHDSVQLVLGLAVTEGDPLAHTICAAAVRADGSRPVDARELVALAAELLVGALVLVTVDPGRRPPGRADLARFVALRHACADARVVLLDWVVGGDDRWWSLRELVIRQAA